MHILLCAATEFEIRPTIESLKEQYIGRVTVLTTGIGLTATTYHLTKVVSELRPALVIQAGIAGSLTADYPLSTVVAIRNESIGDLGVMENNSFNSLFQMGFIGPSDFPWTNKKLANEHDLLYSFGLPVVDAVTINEITTSSDRIKYYQQDLQVQAESMEGAALHYVCLQEKLRFLQIRSLSNFVGERDKTKWLIREAIANLNAELQRILTKLLNT